MAFLIALALALPALGEISVDASLGWGGVAVLGRVNPLWVTVKNPSGASVVGTLEVEWQIGSPWRGRAERCLSAPVVLAPRGQAKLLFPCPVERGTRELSIKVLSGSTPLATASLPVSPAAAPLSGSAGGMAQGVILAPQDLTDPLLLHPFGKIKATTPLPAEAQEALLSWAAFLGGELSGLPPPTPWEWPDRDDLSQAFSRLSLPHPPLAPLALAVATYLLGIGFFLPPAAHGRFRPLTISLTVTWGLSLFSSVLYEPVSGTISCRWILRDDTVGRFGLEFTTLTSIRVGEWRGGGG
ncbi:TPA: hypothetical protein DCL37_03400, partial [Candidatus Acetothermia bacterium]|nr:hypothetical protein [Candidatus Acetothermia bacterium]